MADAPPSEYPQTPIHQWNSNIEALQWQDLQLSLSPCPHQRLSRLLKNGFHWFEEAGLS